ncbi:MAG: GT4 family glycosyltransferase PelF [Alicyclobacillus sp.]|nr:GT4 family glycosyltransferase PelF [Alicyclobacillus sp.]
MSGLSNAGKLSVLLTTEGTYPFSHGGVSTWCDTLVRRLKDVDYTVFAITMDPFIAQKYELPRNAQLIRVPLWGTEEPSEHLDRMFSSTYLAKQRTTQAVVEDQFLPMFRRLVEHIVRVEHEPFAFADLLVELYDFFAQYDYKAAFKSPLVWDAYKQLIDGAVADAGSPFTQPDMYSLLQSLGWIYRFFTVLNTPIPRTTVVHASAAAFCGLPCVVAKVKYGTPFLLTEHGIYLREQYLSLAKRGYPGFLNTFLIRLIHAVVDVNYALADQISPVCAYNTRWERALTDRHERIEVIYNGVDHRVFTQAAGAIRNTRPTVVAVARIDPIKDILGLIRAAQLVRDDVPEVEFHVYGAVSVPAYYEQCRSLVQRFGMEEMFHFDGQLDDVTAAYRHADVVVLSSVSEGFPYSIVEAMLAGKAIVSTDVGGIPEALGDTGILVPPGDPGALAAGIVRLLRNEEEREELGEQARERALGRFTLEQNLGTYLKTYIKLGLGQFPAGARRPHGTEAEERAIPALRQGADHPRLLDAAALREQQLAAERGYALAAAGAVDAAAESWALAVAAAPRSSAVPVLMAEIARVYATKQETAQTRRILHSSFRRHRTMLAEHQRLLAERAFALADAGHLPAAVQQLQRAMAVWPDNPALPVFCLELERLYRALGQTDLAALAQVKYQWLVG